MAICKECPSFIKMTAQCKKCGCFMKVKTRMKDANVKDPCWVCYLDYSVFVIFLNEKIIYIFDIEYGKTSKISSNNSFIVNCWI